MTPMQRIRAHVIKDLIKHGWNPPVPTGVIAERIVDDIIHTTGGATLTLSRREVEIIALMAQGETMEEIGRDIGLTTETVKDTVKSRIRPKLGAKNAANAVAIAVSEGIVDMGRAA